MNEGDGINNQSSGEVKKLLAQIKALKTELILKEENITFLQRNLEEISNQDRNSELLEKIIKENEELKQRLKNSEHEISEITENFESTTKNSNENIKTTIQALENKLKSSIELNDDLKREISNLRKNPEARELNYSNLKLENDLREKIELLEKSDAQLRTLSKKFQEMESRINKSKKDLDKFHDLEIEKNALMELDRNRYFQICFLIQTSYFH